MPSRPISGPGMSAPLKVRVGVLPEAEGVVAFLAENGFDVGSISADRLDPAAPSGLRYLVVALADRDSLADLSFRMQRAWFNRPDLVKLTDNVAVIDTPLDTLLVIFLDVPAIEAQR